MNDAPADISQQAGQQFHAAHGVAGLIVTALVLIFLFHYIGFRFVVAAGGSASGNIGRA